MSKKKSEKEQKEKKGSGKKSGSKRKAGEAAAIAEPAAIAPAAAEPKPKKAKAPAAKAKPAGKGTTVISNDDISLRAYFIAERRHKMGWPGDSTSDWVEAERQLRAEAKRKG